MSKTLSREQMLALDEHVENAELQAHDITKVTNDFPDMTFEDAYDVYGVRNIKTILPRKRVNLEKGSLVARTIRKQCLYVNALHSQAVDKVGQDIRVAGRDPSGMVQAIERTRDPFAIGVQWHPEHLFYRPAHRRLFKSLVAAARARMARAAQLGAAEEAADSDFAPQVASAK